MPIVYPLTPPTSPEARKVSVEPVAIVAVTRSPFTGAQQVQEHQGQQWRIIVELPIMTRAQASNWVAFMLELNGPAGTFLYSPPTERTARGVATGVPVVAGAGQTGNDLNTSGWTAGQAGIMLRGDLIQLGTGLNTRLHKVIQDANSDGAGLATLTIWPALRESPGDLDPIIVSNPKGLFRLASREMNYDIDVAKHYGMAFAAEEVI